MSDFNGQKILVGITGGIAAYKSLLLIRELTQLGAEVRVVMTAAATQFVTPLSIQALCSNLPRTDLFDMEAENGMGHIELARWADVFVIAPASANCLAKLAHGMADDLLSTLYLVTQSPVIICPAMNHSMWSHPATRTNLKTLEGQGVRIVPPEVGAQACGEFGPGRLAEPATIIEYIRLVSKPSDLTGQTVLITAGPTHEPIDPVRFISNRSSGKMGYALAMAAIAAGARVILVSGPVNLTIPQGVEFYPIETAQQMHQTVCDLLTHGMIVIGCAAVGDYAVAKPGEQKIKRSRQSSLSLELQQNPDIIAAVAKSGKPAITVGFAAETEQLITYAQHKLKSKQLDLVIANEVGENKGFGVDENQVSLVTANEVIDLARNHKTRIAGQIIAFIAASLQNTAKS